MAQWLRFGLGCYSSISDVVILNEQMLAVSGIGYTKLERYCKPFSEVIKLFLQKMTVSE